MDINFENIFSGSFDTFKVFRNLKPVDVGDKPLTSPSTIWQTLNHLILWQEYQLNLISGNGNHKQFWESETWIAEKQPKNQQDLDKAVEEIDRQIGQFKVEIKNLSMDDKRVEQKLKIIQEAAMHLSFHLGEIIHLRRILGEYPLPDQMKEFLND